MEDSGITIRYILSRRGGNIEELCDYAKQRGIALTKNDNYVLSEEELKVLDPLLANEIKKKKISEANLLFSFKQKSDREILNYLFDYWKINEPTNQDGSFRVVATYRHEGKDENGYDYGCFADVRSLNGDILYYPFRLGPVDICIPHSEKYTKEPLWLINLRLTAEKDRRNVNPFLLELSDKIFGKPKNSFVDRLGKEKLIRDLFKKRGATADDAQTIANALNILIGDVRTDSERFLFELLQNADDQPYNDTPVNVIFKTLSEHLLVLHNGNSFSSEDVQVISNIGDKSSHKINNKEKTGYKGIGFKSVFSDSDTVYIDSGGFSFAFDKNSPVYNRVPDINAIPWQIKPIWQKRYRLPKEVAEEQNFFSSRVGIALNAGLENIDHYNSIIPRLLHDPRFMLFLRHVENINFQSKDVNVMATKKTNDELVVISNGIVNSDWIVRDYEFEIPDDIKSKIIFEESNKIPQKLKTATRTKISFAVNYDGNRIEKVEKSLLFTYLPTKVEQFKFPFLINADFIVNSSREYVHDDNIWNKFLFEIIGRKTIDWVKTLSDKEDYLNALPTEMDASDSPLFLTYRAAYKAALESEAFILNHKGELAKQEDIIIDETGLSVIVGANLFCRLLDTKKCLPSEKIDSKILKDNIFEEIELLKFDDIIDVICNNEDFNEWFVTATEERRTVLYKWIDENNIKTRENDLHSFVSNLPLFQFREEYKSYEEISSSDYIVTTEHIIPIKEILSKLGFVCSDNVFDENHPLYAFVELQDEVDLFNSIKDCNFSELTADERRTLFFSLADFEGVGDAKLKKEIALFKNVKGEFKPLGEMVAYRVNIPLWLSDYVLCKEDDVNELSVHLVSKEKEFDDIVWKNRNEFSVPITDLYEEYQWTDEKYTHQLISQQKGNDNYRQLLPIVEKSGENTKKLYLQNIDRIDLTSGEEKKYKKDSYECRVLQLAMEVYNEPSVFSSKIYFDGLCIKDFSVSDDVVCEYIQNGETKEVKMSLAKLLPQYQNQSEGIERVKKMFDKQTGIDKFFVSAPKPSKEIFEELNEMLSLSDKYQNIWPLENSNVYQYLFSVYYRKKIFVWFESYNSYSSYYKKYVTNKRKGDTSIPYIELSHANQGFVCELMDYLCDKDISIDKSPFTCQLKTNFDNKYFDSDFIFENERLLPVIEQWADTDKKKKYLTDNGVLTEKCNAIQFRKFFLEDRPINFIDKLSDGDIKSGIEFIATASGFERPFMGENQKNIFLSLKDKCNDLKDNWDNKKMEEKGEEWDTKEYKEWIIEEHHPHILVYPGILPKQLSFKNELLLNYDDAKFDYHYNKQEKKLFVSNSKKIDDILLFEVVKEGKSDFNLDDYKFLCSQGKVSLTKEEKDDYDNLKDEKEKIKSALQKRGLSYDDLLSDFLEQEKTNDKSPYIDEGDDNASPTIKKGSNPPLGTDEKIAAQLDAQKKLQDIYPDWDYPEGFGVGGSYSYFNVKKSNGELMSIVLKSHNTNAPLHVNTNEWDWIIGKKRDEFMFSDNNVFQQNYPVAPAKLFIYTDGDIKELDPKYLIENQPSIALSFSTKNLDIEERITAFSDSLHYFNEMTFDFESFNLSNKAKSIKGLYNRNLNEKQNTETNSINDLF